MVWEQVIRDDFSEGSEVPFVSISAAHFLFNAAFARQAELNPALHVSVHIDSTRRTIGFEFYTEERPNSFNLTPHHNRGLVSAARGVIGKHKWIEAVTKEKTKHRRFPPKKEAGKWVIQLCPAFEEHRARESADIPSDHRGIYRYRRESGEIVYIGRGPIKDRLQLPERKDWDFDAIEYSLVGDPDEQVKWEDFWIERFKEENRGELPFYNKVSGSSKYREG